MAGTEPETPVFNQTEMADDPWAAAFEALNSQNAQASTPDEDERESGDNGADAATESSDSMADADNDAGINSEGIATDTAGLASDYGESAGADAGSLSDLFDGADIDPATYEQDLRASLNSKVINDVAEAFKKKNVRVQSNGALGASINDPDIMQVDQDGAVRFFNPDTGREFTGDNPRRQALEWVNDYNDDLRRAFNTTCQQYEDALIERQAPQMAVVAFAPTFNAMDPVRKQLFNSMIEGYEITDRNGDVVGYSCDLNKVNATMERQIALLQSIGASNAQGSGQTSGAGQHTAASKTQPQNNGPALDMRADHGQRDRPTEEPKSVADAMLILQQQQLDQLHSRDKRR